MGGQGVGTSCLPYLALPLPVPLSPASRPFPCCSRPVTEDPMLVSLFCNLTAYATHGHSCHLTFYDLYDVTTVNRLLPALSSPASCPLISRATLPPPPLNGPDSNLFCRDTGSIRSRSIFFPFCSFTSFKNQDIYLKKMRIQLESGEIFIEVIVSSKTTREFRSSVKAKRRDALQLFRLIS